MVDEVISVPDSPPLMILPETPLLKQRTKTFEKRLISMPDRETPKLFKVQTFYGNVQDQDHLETLMNMFPSKDKKGLEALLADHCIEDAIKVLLTPHSPSPILKRRRLKRKIDLNSRSPSPVDQPSASMVGPRGDRFKSKSDPIAQYIHSSPVQKDQSIAVKTSSFNNQSSPVQVSRSISSRSIAISDSESDIDAPSTTKQCTLDDPIQIYSDNESSSTVNNKSRDESDREYPEARRITVISDSSEDEEEMTSSEMTCLLFVNTATDAEWKEQLELDQSQRRTLRSRLPFSSYINMEQDCPTKIFKLIAKYESTLESYELVDSIINDCEALGVEMNTITKAWDTQTPIDYLLLKEQPRYVNQTLRLKGYQLRGVSWLNVLYQKSLGGILADEMGLGKTAQVISFLGLLLEQGDQGPHLIIVPSSTVDNWLRELGRWCPLLKSIAYCGTQTQRREIQERVWMDQEPFHVVVTTYNMAAGTKEDRAFLRRLRCQSMILDEGHMIKNADSQRFRHLMSFNTPFRLLLTGTPIQNNLVELLSLLTFIMPDLFAEHTDTFAKLFSAKMKSSSLSHPIIERARSMMNPFLLRRKKQDVLNDLPGKIRQLEECFPTTRQAELYQSILDDNLKRKQGSLKDQLKTKQGSFKDQPKGKQGSFKDQPKGKQMTFKDQLKTKQGSLKDQLKTKQGSFKEHPKPKPASSNQAEKKQKEREPMETTNILMQLRKVANHPLLIHSLYHDEKLEILEVVLETLNIHYLRLDGQTPQAERQVLIDQYQTESIPVFLLSTKAGGFGINLTSIPN